MTMNLIIHCLFISLSLCQAFRPPFSQDFRLQRECSLLLAQQAAPRWQRIRPSNEPSPTIPHNGGQVTAKSVTNEIMRFFSENNKDVKHDMEFKVRLADENVRKNIDGLHVLTILFQSARQKRYAKNFLPIEFMIERLKAWDRTWSERDISTFVYGVRALEGFSKGDGELLRLGAEKIRSSPVKLSTRGIGNALYGLQDITSDAPGAKELCSALTKKVQEFDGDLSGQDIGIGIYGLQGMSADAPQVRGLIDALAEKIKASEAELDAQALGNALYGMQVRKYIY